MSFKAALGFFASLAITALLSAGLARAEPVKLVGFGDSLMAGYQLPAADAFPGARLVQGDPSFGVVQGLALAGQP